MNVLIIGSGGREHSLLEKVKQDADVGNVYMLGDNGAIAPEALVKDIDGLNFHDVYKFIKDRQIEMTIVGPEQYLEAGIVDYLRAHNCTVIGPSKYCAKLESSKQFAKEMMKSQDIPTAKYQYVSDSEAGLAAIAHFGYPVVLKFDGLAAGKGVLVCESEEQASEYFKNVFENKCFGAGGVVVEECLCGEEYSVFAYVNGENYAILPIAQDYKRACDGDLGPNTGGMGANTTAKFDDQLPFIEQRILQPLLAKFVADGYKYTGFLYIGLMQTVDGPKVIEFNVRMGDPETQVVMQKLESSLISLVQTVDGGNNFKAAISDEQFVGVVLAANGYPNKYLKNVILVSKEKMQPLYHMGTCRRNGQLLSTGGRVMMVTSSGHSVEAARTSVYKKLEKFENRQLFYRKDIANGRI